MKSSVDTIAGYRLLYAANICLSYNEPPYGFTCRTGGLNPGKFWAWTDCDGHPENIFNRDDLLDNVMLYWVTRTATSSARLYWESFGKRRTTPIVNVPTGVAVFPKEIITPVRRWMEPNFTNITDW